MGTGSKIFLNNLITRISSSIYIFKISLNNFPFLTIRKKGIEL